MKTLDKNLIISKLLFTIIVIFLVGCLSNPKKDIASNQLTFAEKGVISITRSLPSVNKQEPDTLLGFMPSKITQHEEEGVSSLIIDTKAQTAALVVGKKTVNEFSGEGLSLIKPGQYTIVHKQRHPLWYAPDSYFIKRGQPVPAEGSSERYRLGALGEFVIYINKDTPIHSAPIWCDDVGGIRLSDSDISKLYYSIEVGATVTVK